MLSPHIQSAMSLASSAWLRRAARRRARHPNKERRKPPPHIFPNIISSASPALLIFKSPRRIDSAKQQKGSRSSSHSAAACESEIDGCDFAITRRVDGLFLQDGSIRAGRVWLNYFYWAPEVARAVSEGPYIVYCFELVLKLDAADVAGPGSKLHEVLHLNCTGVKSVTM